MPRAIRPRSATATVAFARSARRLRRLPRAEELLRERVLSFAQRSQFPRVQRVELALDAVHDDANDEHGDGEVEENSRFDDQWSRVNQQQAEQVNAIFQNQVT